MKAALLLFAAATSVELTCNKDALVLVLRATAGVATGVADLDMPRVSLLDTEAERAALIAARNIRVRTATERVLLSCAQPAPAPSPAPSPEAK